MDATAQRLARFVSRLSLTDVPPAVRTRAKHLLLDAVGCGLAAHGEGFARRYAEGVHALAGESAGTRGVLGHARRLPLRDAALLNGVLMHGLDYDDTHMAGVIHLTVGVLPAALGVAAERDAGGAELLAAYVAALEAGARIASATRGGLHAQGFHPTAVVGTFAAALAAAKLQGLDEAGLLRAQGVALSLAGGSLQFIEDGAWTKRLHPGWAAQAGIAAAVFAGSGIVAPQAPYEGRFGLYRAFLGEAQRAHVDLSLAAAGLDDEGRSTRWELEHVAVKPFPVCHFVHACADAAIALHRAGVDVQRIREVVALVPEAIVPAVCEPIAGKRAPKSDYDAKFSLPYGVASGLLRGRLGLAELEPAAFTDPAARALMQRVRYEVDPASTFPRHYTGEVRVVLDDGSVLAHREAVNRGHAERPLTNDEVSEKFHANATRWFGAAHAERVREAVLAIDTAPSVRPLETLLATPP